MLHAQRVLSEPMFHAPLFLELFPISCTPFLILETYGREHRKYATALCPIRSEIRKEASGRPERWFR